MWSRDFVRARSEATLRAARANWRQYVAWCEGTRHSPLPASTRQLVAFLLNAIARGRRLATVHRYLFTVSLLHGAVGLPNPAKDRAGKFKWKAVLKLHQRVADDPVLDQQLTSRRAGRLLRQDIGRILATLGDTPIDLRDGATLLLASDAPLRESELVRVRVEHFTENRSRGTWSLSVPLSKSNRTGEPDERRASRTTIARVHA